LITLQSCGTVAVAESIVDSAPVVARSLLGAVRDPERPGAEPRDAVRAIVVVAPGERTAPLTDREGHGRSRDRVSSTVLDGDCWALGTVAPTAAD
jgi:hypothetical protein